VGVVSGSLYRRTHSLSRLAWSWVGGRLAPFYIHQMNRVNSRKSQWLCHDDSTINIVVLIIINALVSITVVLLRRARLVPTWVTVFGQVNHLSTEPGTTSTQPNTI